MPPPLFWSPRVIPGIPISVLSVFVVSETTDVRAKVTQVPLPFPSVYNYYMELNEAGLHEATIVLIRDFFSVGQYRQLIASSI